ncbi:polygalacturonase-like [Ziziphus jujuba]|uniref:Polygalacturonase-like n=1 Tax=Ziziphus jujuba TaxID=326968 RepID=A0ABM3I782_ZIZJJ|nr:polygalacturonase-like [Ziziphus jujuba]
MQQSLAFDFINDSKVHHLRSINSKNAHFNIYGCRNMNLSKIRLSAPDESPNTDGIKIGSSHRIKISRTVIATGDDCIAMLSGSTKIHISKVVCGPGHGISIGSLGRYDGEQDVSGIVVKNSTFTGTTNGVRIKTWPTPTSCKAFNFLFQDIIMENVFNPITIDQLYCPHGGCDQQASSNVQISDVTYKNIVGSSSSEVAVSLICSRSKPCNKVILDNINLEYVGKGDSKSSCVNVVGVSYGQQTPPTCF